MNELLFKLIENSFIVFATAVLFLLFSWLFRNKTSPILRRMCWLFLFVCLLIPIRPTLINVPLPQENTGILPTSFYRQPSQNRINLEMRLYDHTSEQASLNRNTDNTIQSYVSNDNREDSYAVQESMTYPHPGKISFDGNNAVSQENNIHASSSLSLFERIGIQNWDLKVLLTYIWIIGMITALTVYITWYLRFIRRIKRTCIPVNGSVLNDLLDDVCREAGLNRYIRLAICPAVKTPVVVGFFRPVIYLPDEPVNYEELRFIFMHEVVHIKTGDTWSRLLSLSAMIVHWFNPLVYLMNRALLTETELACDAAVLKITGEEQRLLYGQTVFRTAKRSWENVTGHNQRFVTIPAESIPVSAFSDTGKILRRRLSGIIDRGKTRRWVAICCAIVLLSGVITGGLSGCGNSGGLRPREWESVMQFDTPEYLYTQEIMDFPTIPYGGDYWVSDWIRNFSLIDNKVYFSVMSGQSFMIGNETGEIRTAHTFHEIYSLDTDTMEITRLLSFNPIFSPDDSLFYDRVIKYDIIIGDFHVTDTGNILLTDHVEVFTIDNFDTIDLQGDRTDITNEIMLNQRTLHEHVVIKKTDNTGADLIDPIPIPDTIVHHHWANTHYVYIDIQDNIYFVSGYSPTNDSVFVFNTNGEIIFSLGLNGNLVSNNGVMSLSNNKIAVAQFMNDVTISEIDVENKSWGRTFDLPGSFMNTRVFPGNDEYDVFYTVGAKMFGYNIETDKATEIFSGTDSGININNIHAVDILNDGRIKLIYQSTDEDTWEHTTQIIYLTKVPYGDISNRTLLTLGAVHLDRDIQDAVANFNRTSHTHFIQVIDYAMYDTGGDWGWIDAVNRLSLDMTTGKIPDMIAVSNYIPLQRYALIGLLEDLYPFIDDDPVFNRESFLTGVLQSSEINGELYRLFPNFAVYTLIGNPYFLGSELGWDMDEFQTVLRNNPNADKPLGNWATRSSFLESAFPFYVDNFIDWERGRADFNNRRFIRILESMAFLPNTFESGTLSSTEALGDPELIATGRQIMYMLWLMNFEQLQVYQTVFGGEIVFKGYPSDDKNGNALIPNSGVAMTVTCKDKAGAWEFIRSFVTEDWQRKQGDLNFPVNKTVFEERLEKAMIEPEQPHNIRWGEFEVPATALTREQADQIIAMIANTSNIQIPRDMYLWNIVNEESSRYFAGQITAQDAARIIQSRTSIYMSEQAG